MTNEEINKLYKEYSDLYNAETDLATKLCNSDETYHQESLAEFQVAVMATSDAWWNYKNALNAKLLEERPFWKKLLRIKTYQLR